MSEDSRKDRPPTEDQAPSVPPAGPSPDVERVREQLDLYWLDFDAEDLANEAEARPENDTQAIVVAYLGDQFKLTDLVLDAFLHELRAPEPNDALWRGYFRTGHPRLKALLLEGLRRHPDDADLLADLGYFHHFHPLPAELEAHYHRACLRAAGPTALQRLLDDFAEACPSRQASLLQGLHQAPLDNPDCRALIARLAIDRL